MNNGRPNGIRPFKVISEHKTIDNSSGTLDLYLGNT